jgi:hypothetical protein
VSPDSELTSAERLLVEELGAEFVGTLVRLGEFLISDGEETGEDLVSQACAWLKDKKLMYPRSRRSVSWATVVGCPDELTLRVYRGKAWTEYHFRVTSEPIPKRYHFVAVSVLIPPSSTSGFDGDPTPLGDRGPGYQPEKRGGPPTPADRAKRY